MGAETTLVDDFTDGDEQTHPAKVSGSAVDA